MLMFLTYIIKFLLLILYVMLMVAFYTILERKIIAYIQIKKGFNIVRPFELLQAIADGLKLLVKKTIIPQTANIMIFIAGPLITFNLSYLGSCIIPFDKRLNDFLSYLDLFFQKINNLDFHDQVLKFFNLLSELSTDEILFRIFLILLYVGTLFFNYMTDRAFFKKIHFLILTVILFSCITFIFPFSNFFNISKLTGLGMKILVITFLGSIAILKWIKQEPDDNEISKGLPPVLDGVANLCLSNPDFIICFQPLSEISQFEIINGEISQKYYPLFKGPFLIYGYTLVGYALETDITNLHLRYLICTSYSDKIKDFNQIINYLIQHFETSSEIQEKNLGELTAFMKNLQNKNGEISDVFTVKNYLTFILDNNHLISEILQFWESLNLKKSDDYQVKKNKNFREIKILESVIRINPFAINSLHLKKDRKNLGTILYSFFYQYSGGTSFKTRQMTSIDFDEFDIVTLFYTFAFNNKNLNLEKFTQDLIDILKASK